MDDTKQTDEANLKAAGQSDAVKSASTAGPDTSTAKSTSSPGPDDLSKASSTTTEPAKAPAKSLDEIARERGLEPREGNGEVGTFDPKNAGRHDKIGTSDPASLEPFRNPAADAPRDGSSVVDVSSADAKVRQIEQTERDLEQRNKSNREGHELNMERIERAGEQAMDASRAAPPTGKENNRNTPIIGKDGTKRWD